MSARRTSAPARRRSDGIHHRRHQRDADDGKAAANAPLKVIRKTADRHGEDGKVGDHRGYRWQNGTGHEDLEINPAHSSSPHGVDSQSAPSARFENNIGPDLRILRHSGSVRTEGWMDNRLLRTRRSRRDPAELAQRRVSRSMSVEHRALRSTKPSTSIFGGTAMLVPDPLNYGWRDYAVRVGIWRMIEALDAHKMRASVLLNADCCAHYPQIIEAGRERNWVWLAHGKNNSIFQTGMSVDDERKYLKEIVATVSKATGHQIRGWLGPALTETFETPRLLQERLTYVLDWCADDQPLSAAVPGIGAYSSNQRRQPVCRKSLSGGNLHQRWSSVRSTLRDGGRRVAALCLHPFIINQPFRQKYLEKALAYIAKHDGVWLTTSDDIAAHYAKNYLPRN
jgi:peptidoglycan/xylan/chitin deacetylase (PgdA/CDA1 family)